MKKKFKLLQKLFIFSFCLILSACSASATDEVLTEEVVLETPAPDFFTQDAKGLDFRSTYNDTYYISIFHPYQEEIPLQAKITPDGEFTYLCDLEGCEHLDETCHAFNPLINLCVFESQDNLYGINLHLLEGTFIANDLSVTSFSKTNFSDSETVAYLENYVYDNSYDDIVVYENFLFFPASKKLSEDDYQPEILKVDLNTGDVETIHILADNQYRLKIGSIFDGNLIFTAQTDTYSTHIYSINLNDNSVIELDSSKNNAALPEGEIDSEYMYTIEDSFLFYRIDIFTGEKELLIDLSTTPNQFGAFTKIVDGYFYYNTKKAINSTPSTNIPQYAFNLETLETTTITLNTPDGGGFNTRMAIVGVYEDSYLVVSDYITNITLQLSTISKADYMASNPNFNFAIQSPMGLPLY